MVGTDYGTVYDFLADTQLNISLAPPSINIYETDLVFTYDRLFFQQVYHSKNQYF